MRRAVITLLACAVAILLPRGVTPAQAEPVAEVRAKAVVAFNEVDARLRAVFERVIAAAPEDTRAKMRKAQRTFTLYRDAAATAEAAIEQDASAAAMAWLRTATRLTEGRIRDLEALLSTLRSP